MSYRILLGVVCALSIIAVQPASAQQPPSARIVLAADMEGRFTVRNASQELIAEVYKPAGRPLTLNVEPGSYQVRLEREKTTQIAAVSVVDGAELVIDHQQLGPPAASVPVSTQGEMPTYALTGRNRFDFRFGAWTHPSTNAVVIDGVSSDVTGGIRYTRYFTESLAATFSMEGGGAQAGTVRTPTGVYDGGSGLFRVPVGIRWNPLQFGRQKDGIKPFVAFSAGPVFGDSVYDARRGGGSIESSATIGGFAGGGIDLHAGRTCVFGMEFGYNWMGDFGESISGVDNYSGPTVSINLGFMWGRGSTPRP